METKADAKSKMHMKGLDEIGNSICDLRKKQNLSQDKLAERAGLSRNSISSIENGSNFAVETLASICLALQVTPNDLLCHILDADLPERSEEDREVADLLNKYFKQHESSRKKCRQILRLFLAQCSGDKIELNVTENQGIVHWR